MRLRERLGTLLLGLAAMSVGLWLIGIAAAELSVKTGMIGAAVAAAGFLVTAIATREEREIN